MISDTPLTMACLQCVCVWWKAKWPRKRGKKLQSKTYNSNIISVGLSETLAHIAMHTKRQKVMQKLWKEKHNLHSKREEETTSTTTTTTTTEWEQNEGASTDIWHKQTNRLFLIRCRCQCTLYTLYQVQCKRKRHSLRLSPSVCVCVYVSCLLDLKIICFMHDSCIHFSCFRHSLWAILSHCK